MLISKPRVVLDTSVLLSYLLNPDRYYAVRVAVGSASGLLQAITCDAAISELIDVGNRYCSSVAVNEFVFWYRDSAKIVIDPLSRFVHQVDPKDSLFFDLAIANEAYAIVSFDIKHVLAVREESHSQHKELLAIAPKLKLLHPREMALELEVMRLAAENP